METRDRQGRKERTTRNKDEGKGTPQGSPISPLLSNIYMRRFIRGWKTGGHEQRLESYIVNYADDFVICCRADADEAMATMRSMMAKLKLTVNETKTRLSVLPDGAFDFLGYTFGRCYNHRTGAAYLAASPAKKKIAKLCDAIGEQTSKRCHHLDEGEMVGRLNRKLRVAGQTISDLGAVSRGYSRGESPRNGVGYVDGSAASTRSGVRGTLSIPGPIPVPKAGPLPAQPYWPEIPEGIPV